MRYEFSTGEVIDVPDNLNLQGLLGYVWHIWHKGYSAGVAHVPFGGVKKEFSKITVIPFAGADIKDIANETIRMATLFHCPVEFDFNGVQMCVTHATDPENACNIYRAAARKPTASELRDKFAAENKAAEPIQKCPNCGKPAGECEFYADDLNASNPLSKEQQEKWVSGRLFRSEPSYDYLRGFRDGVREMKK